MPSILNATTTSGLVTSADNSGSLQLQTNNGTTAVTIDTSQNVGIGTTSPSNRLDVSGIITASGSPANPTGTTVSFYNGSGIGPVISGFQFAVRTGVTPAERMRIDSDGRLLVGTASNIDTMPIQSVSTTRGQFLCRFSTASAGKFWSIGPDSSSSNLTVYNQGGAGVFILDGGTSWNGTSDERLKNITGEISNGIDKVCSLRAIEFTWKSDELNQKRVGLVAQEVQQVLPEAVNENTEGYLGIAYTETIPLLVAAIKELKAELDATKAEVQALKGVA